MKTSLERLEPTKVKLTVEVEPERVAAAFDAAARELARTLTIPGFRKGKIPRRVLESKIGKAPIAQEAMEHGISAFYSEALRAESVAAVAPPEIDLQTFTEEEGCTFEATIQVRPEIELPDHTGISVSFPDWEVSDAEVDEHIDQLRDRFAELEEVDRPAAIGDYVTIDLAVDVDGEPLEMASAEDALYEVGSGGVTPRLDEELAGAVAGATLSYEDALPEGYPEHGGETVHFTVTVKDVRAKQLPALDDDFAATASEFDTLEELREDIRGGLRRRRLATAQQELRARILEAYLATVDVPLPEAMLDAEVSARHSLMERQAERYGMELEQLLELQGTDHEGFHAQLREQATSTVKAQLVLEELAQAQEIKVDERDLELEITRHALQRGVEPAEIAKVVNEQGTVGVLIGDIVRRKALDLLVDAAEVEGAPPPDVLDEAVDGPEPLDIEIDEE